MPSLPDPPLPEPAPPDAWAHLRRHTTARIALGRSGGSLPTRETLSFSLDHAEARDAVMAEFRGEAIARSLQGLFPDVVALDSAAASRAIFVARPDLGRRLSEDSAFRAAAMGAASDGFDLVIIVSAGLSARAADEQAAPLLKELVPRLQQFGFRLAPLCLVPNGRVGLQDEIGSLLHARMALTLLGERPGLGVANSLGAYLIFGPRPGRTDADRNCVSNIRPAGLGWAMAAERIASLLDTARAKGVSGIAIKEDEAQALPAGTAGKLGQRLE